MINILFIEHEMHAIRLPLQEFSMKTLLKVQYPIFDFSYHHSLQVCSRKISNGFKGNAG